MNADSLLIFFLMAMTAAAVCVVLVRAVRPERCPNARCRRSRVAGLNRCPFCGTPYTGQPSPNIPSAPASYELRFIQGPQSGQRRHFGPSPLTIGRAKTNDLVLEGLLISRNHAQIVYEQGNFVIYDKDSTNGTYVNGQRIAAHPLSHGDRIQIGPYVLEFLVVRQPKEAIAPGPSPTPEKRHSSVTRLPEPGVEDYVLTPIHSGGFATVYRGVSRRDPNNIVAVKILNQTDAYARDKFVQEGHLGRILKHPNIVAILGAGTMDGLLYIMMEFVDGGTLRDRLVPGTPMPIADTVRIAAQVCSALQYAHDHHVVHRDIKPENIMFTSNGTVKVVDFGIARWAARTTITSFGVILGTPWYLSPEQAKGLPTDHRTDIYSLGVVLYEMLTGTVPFDGDPLSVMHQHITRQPRPLRELNPNVPVEIERTVLRALAKDRMQRFGSAAQMAAALQTSAGIRMSPPPARKVDTTGRAARPSAMLTLISSRGSRRSIPLGSGELVIGRDLLDPNDHRLSRRHARVVLRGGHYWIEDLRSKNGTFVNGVRVFQPVLLTPGSKIQVGEYLLEFTM